MKPPGSTFGDPWAEYQGFLPVEQRKKLRAEVEQHYDEFCAKGGKAETIPGKRASRMYKPVDLWKQTLQ